MLLDGLSLKDIVLARGAAENKGVSELSIRPLVREVHR
jgi:hypothetical protein